MPAFWWHIANHVTFGIDAMWIPSHDKNPLWAPQVDWGLSVSHCRRLNAAADAAAKEITGQLWLTFSNNCLEIVAAHAWAGHAFTALRKCTFAFHEHFDLINASMEQSCCGRKSLTHGFQFLPLPSLGRAPTESLLVCLTAQEPSSGPKTILPAVSPLPPSAV